MSGTPPSVPELSPGAVRLLRLASLAAATTLVLGACMTLLLPGNGAGWDGARRAAFALGAIVGASTLLPVRANLAALLVTTLLVAGAAATELVLRVFAAPHYAVLYRIDEDRLHELVPNGRKIFTHRPENGGGNVLVETNADGFRGGPLESADVRVAVFGDSTIAAEFSELDRTFVARLEDELETGLGRTVEAVNAGVPAYGPDQALRRMQAWLPRLRPDFVVFAVFADNDFGDLLRDKLYRLDERGELADNPHRIGDGLRREFLAARQSPLTTRCVDKTLRPAVLNALRRLLGREHPRPGQSSELEIQRMEGWLAACEREYRDTVVEADPVVTALLGDHYDADVSLTPNSESARYKVALMDRVLARAADVAAAAKVPLLLLFIPSPIDVCEDYDLGRVDRARHPDYDPRRMVTALDRSARDHGIPYVDLTPAYVERGACGLYLRGGDNHWNDAGQALAAELVARAVEDRLGVGAKAAESPEGSPR